MSLVLHPGPAHLATLDGLKVESLVVRELPGVTLDLFVGLDDENYGGSLRPIPCFAQKCITSEE